MNRCIHGSQSLLCLCYLLSENSHLLVVVHPALLLLVLVLKKHGPLQLGGRLELRLFGIQCLPGFLNLGKQVLGVSP